MDGHPADCKLPPLPHSHSSPANPRDPSSTPSSTIAQADINANLPATPTSPTSPESKPKKSNPLNDLIETEKTYVDQLTGIIRKIAAAWSRSNLPPRELDTMFRSIESIYKANKALLAKLTEIGTNPSSPKALGDLLMKWIDDLEAPYTNYCNKYCCGFDFWDPVKSNQKLLDILADFSAALPPTSPEQSIWTLDALFLLPKARLKYYRRLYNRLLKGTVVGRSDHKLLVGALEKLGALLELLESRLSNRVDMSGVGSSPTAEELGVEDRNVVDLRTQSASNVVQQPNESEPNPIAPVTGLRRGSEEMVAATAQRKPSTTFKTSIADLERRISPERTLDIFTMNSKAVRLQISSPNLTFTRETRLSLDVVIRFTSKATNAEVVHHRGHIFILTDLLLICERMTPQERQHGSDQADMWLCYPPLAGKVLRTSELEGQPHILQLAVMKKEFLIIETHSVNTRNALMQYLKECIEFSSSLPPPPKEPPPPVPPLKMPPLKMPPSNSIPPDPRQSQNGPIPQASPLVGNPRLSIRHVTPRRTSQDSVRHAILPNKMSEGPQAQLQRMPQRTLSAQNYIPGPVPPRGSSVPPIDYQPRPHVNSAFPPQPQGYTNSPAPPFPGAPAPAPLNQPNFPPQPQGYTNSPAAPFPGAPAPAPLNQPNFPPQPQGYTNSPAAPFPGAPAPAPLNQPNFPPQPQGYTNSPAAPFPGAPAPAPLNQPNFPPQPQGYTNSPAAPFPGAPAPAPLNQPNFPPQPQGYTNSPAAPFPGAPAPAPLTQPNFPPHPQGFTNFSAAPFPGAPAPAPLNQPNFPRQGPAPPVVGQAGVNLANGPPFRPSFDPAMPFGAIRKSSSMHSLASQRERSAPQPPVLNHHPPDFARNGVNSIPRTGSTGNLPAAVALPSAQMKSRAFSTSFDEPSPPSSPVQEIKRDLGPVTSTVVAQMKCKVFLQQQHAQWKSLGSAKLTLYRQSPTNVKQIVVESNKTTLISTIVLTDGVERVAKTGVAIELSDKGARTGIIYMLQLRDEVSAAGLYSNLLAGSDRSG